MFGTLGQQRFKFIDIDLPAIAVKQNCMCCNGQRIAFIGKGFADAR